MTRDLGEQQKAAGAKDVHQGQRTGMRRRRTPHVDALNVGKGERVFRPGKARGQTESVSRAIPTRVSIWSYHRSS